MKKIYFTALERKLDRSSFGGDDFLLAGHWALDNLNELSTTNVFPYHWQNRNKFSSDYNKLEEFYETQLSALSSELSKLHNLNFSTEQWRVIIGPWLYTYVAVLFDRYETVRLLNETFESLKMVAVTASPLSPPFDYQEALDCFQDDYWNSCVFRDLTNLPTFKSTFKTSVKVLLQKAKIDKKYSQIRHSRRKTVLRQAAIFFDKIVSSSFFPKKVIFVSHYLPWPAVLKLCLQSHSMFSLHSIFFNDVKKNELFDHNFRGLKATETMKSFSEFFNYRWRLDIPVAYVENLNTYIESVKNYAPECHTLFTANSHYSNEFVKVFIALKKDNSAFKLITSNHGGGIKSYFVNFNHEEKISDHKVVWCRPYHETHVQLPANKLMNKAIIKSSKEYLTVIGFELPKFAYRMQSGPNSSLMVQHIRQQASFLENISDGILIKLNFRPHSYDSWGSTQLIAQKFGSQSISTRKNIYRDFAVSRLIICTYPMTTFSEAMLSNIPTILLLDGDTWELEPKFHKIVKELQKAQIIFSDPIEAASHINRYWLEPYDWWMRAEVQRARSSYLLQCTGMQSTVTKPLLHWKRFFNEIVKP